MNEPVFVSFADLPRYGVPPFSRVHILRMQRDGKFSLQLQISDNRVGWRLHSILDWVANRPPSKRVRVEGGDAQ